ncbi:hypothetical protein [Algoriphagus limi]|uniref:Lipocalin-like domain-containing protein n=1 Tax=Algoriphagus limi TaxID=2975273 RepID=A0ABT2G6Q4_9BACT|nr:hypothetical protein [Algoriphagus limi]MCS5490951.1 hypothetical protein [Algoriphagus limi]
MKKLFGALFFLLVVLSCQDDTDPLDPIFDREWIFSGYQSSSVPNPTFYPISDSLYTYRFKSNGDFTKFIGNYELNGSFQIIEDQVNQREYLTLEYDQQSYQLHRDADGFGLIHSCEAGSETLFFEDPETLIGSWSACDGPVLFFIRK